MSTSINTLKDQNKTNTARSAMDELKRARARVCVCVPAMNLPYSLCTTAIICKLICKCLLSAVSVWEDPNRSTHDPLETVTDWYRCSTIQMNKHKTQHD